MDNQEGIEYDLAEQITLKTWNKMANAALGYAVRLMAIQVRDFFGKLIQQIKIEYK